MIMNMTMPVAQRAVAERPFILEIGKNSQSGTTPRFAPQEFCQVVSRRSGGDKDNLRPPLVASRQMPRLTISESLA